MSSSLCIDPDWQRYYESLEFPISQAPENCEEIDAYNPHTETSCVPQAVPNAFPTSGLWRTESPNANREISLADALPLMLLRQLAQRLKQVYWGLREDRTIPAHTKRPINTAAGQIETIAQRSSGDQDPARYYPQDAQTLGFYAQKLTALLAPNILPEASREALRPLTIHLLMHNAEYLGKIGSYAEAFEALSRAAALLSDDERLLLDPVLRGTPPHTENELGGMVREWRVAIARAHIDALIQQGHTIPPSLSIEMPSHDGRLPANLYLASLVMRLEQIDIALEREQFPDRTATRRFLAIARWYYEQAPPRTEPNPPPRCTPAYLNSIIHYFEFLDGKIAYNREGQSEDAQRTQIAAAAWLAGIPELHVSVINPARLEEVARSRSDFLRTSGRIEEALTLIEPLYRRFPFSKNGARSWQDLGVALTCEHAELHAAHAAGLSGEERFEELQKAYYLLRDAESAITYVRLPADPQNPTLITQQRKVNTRLLALSRELSDLAPTLGEKATWDFQVARHQAEIVVNAAREAQALPADTPLAQETDYEIRRLLDAHKHGGAAHLFQNPGALTLEEVEHLLQAQATDALTRLHNWHHRTGIEEGALAPDLRALLLIRLAVDPDLKTPSDGQITALVAQLQMPDTTVEVAERNPSGKAEREDVREDAKERGAPHAK